MIFKHKKYKKVTVITKKGKVAFINGYFETEDKEIIEELSKNKKVMKVDKKEEITKKTKETEDQEDE